MLFSRRPHWRARLGRNGKVQLGRWFCLQEIRLEQLCKDRPLIHPLTSPIFAEFSPCVRHTADKPGVESKHTRLDPQLPGVPQLYRHVNWPLVRTLGGSHRRVRAGEVSCGRDCSPTIRSRSCRWGGQRSLGPEGTRQRSCRLEARRGSGRV